MPGRPPCSAVPWPRCHSRSSSSAAVMPGSGCRDQLAPRAPRRRGSPPPRLNPARAAPPLDPRHELRLERQHAVEAEDVGHEVVGEHRQLAEVGRVDHAGAVEVGGGDLRPLEERQPELVVAGGVGKARPAAEQLGQRRGRSAGDRGQREEPAAELRLRPGRRGRAASSANSAISGWLRVLAAAAGELRRLDRGQLGGGPGPVGVEAPADAAGDRAGSRWRRRPCAASGTSPSRS